MSDVTYQQVADLPDRLLAQLWADGAADADPLRAVAVATALSAQLAAGTGWLIHRALADGASVDEVARATPYDPRGVCDAWRGWAASSTAGAAPAAEREQVAAVIRRAELDIADRQRHGRPVTMLRDHSTYPDGGDQGDPPAGPAAAGGEHR